MTNLSPDQLHSLLDAVADDALSTPRAHPSRMAVPLVAAAVAIVVAAGVVAGVRAGDTSAPPPSGVSSSVARPFSLADVERLMTVRFRPPQDVHPAFTEEQALAAADDPAAYSLGLHSIVQGHFPAGPSSRSTVWVIAAEEDIEWQPQPVHDPAGGPSPSSAPSLRPSLVLRLYDSTTGSLLDGMTFQMPVDGVS